MTQALETTDLDAARAGDEAAFARLVGPYRRELKAHCYRLSGSLHDADDLLQDSLLRAWKGLGPFEGRSSLRTWLYKITTNACLNDLESKKRSLPADLGPPGSPTDAMAPRFEPIWLEPCPEELYADPTLSPEAAASERESVALAFVAALQRLAPNQRAVLLLHDVLGWRASECADLLDTTVHAVNSALQRARQAIADGRVVEDEPPRDRVARYIQAWESADLGALVALLHEEATLSMPPIPVWLRGRSALAASMRAMVFTPGATFRAVETRANGRPALAIYRHEDGELRPYAIQILAWDAGAVTAITAFLDTTLFAAFGLPARA